MINIWGWRRKEIVENKYKMATLIARLQTPGQYNEKTQILTFKDGTNDRWEKVYSKLQSGDKCMFYATDKKGILVGDYVSSIKGKSLKFNNVIFQEITNDNLLRIHDLSPEMSSRMKANFDPFTPQYKFNASAVLKAAKTGKILDMFIVHESLLEKLPFKPKANDRIISVNNKNTFQQIFSFESSGLKEMNLDGDLFGAKGKSLNEIMKISEQQDKKNHVNSIRKILEALKENGFYKFPSFNDYYNIVHNKRLFLEDGFNFENGEDQTDSEKIESLNQILYGPPGTGKTYNSIFYAVAIIENKEFSEIEAESKTNFDEVKRRYDRYISEGKIVFTTFHQSMGYEDFIEGIKPVVIGGETQQVIYKVVDGIFKELCNTASSKIISNFENSYQAFLDELSSKEEGIKLVAGKETIGISLMENGFDLKIDSNSYIKSISKAGLKYVSDSQSFVGIWGKYYKAIFKNLSDNYGYKTESTDLNQKYVLIIDEINRGNVSQIFGELITLIEEDKRSDGKVAFKVTLPYSKKPFEIPNNIYIIGTMNTADRSVEALDTALRRRFSFIPMMPKEDTLETTHDGINLMKLLQTINNRLRVLKDNDHTIGHAWLWNVNNLDGLKEVFGNKILPLLQEYFYNDYEKLGLVLGDPFFRKHQIVDGDLFASFSGGNGLAGQYDQTYQYQLKSMGELTIDDFKSLEKTIKPVESNEEQ